MSEVARRHWTCKVHVTVFWTRAANCSRDLQAVSQLMRVTLCFMAVLSGRGSGEWENDGSFTLGGYNKGSTRQNDPCNTG